MDGHKDVQREIIISRHYRVTGYNNVVCEAGYAPSIDLSDIQFFYKPEGTQWSQKQLKKSLHYGEVRRDVLQPPHNT